MQRLCALFLMQCVSALFLMQRVSALFLMQCVSALFLMQCVSAPCQAYNRAEGKESSKKKGEGGCTG